MTQDVASLVLESDSSQIRNSTRDLNQLTRAGQQAGGATESLRGFIAGLGATLFSAAAAGMALRKAITVQREFDVINAGLITATGSADNASVAFEALREFAANTPYDLAQVSDSFIKLVNLGLDPSERAMMSYGNTASAMGKDLNMLVEAVADAATGEFERLKEFGIKARSQGDQVALTFQGVTTTIGKNASEIEDYLIGIGEVNFAGAMEQRMDSLDGKLSNLGDSLDEVFRGIMASPFGDAIESSVEGAIAALENLNSYLTGGEFEGALDRMGAAWGPWADDASQAVDIVWDALVDFLDWIDQTYPGSIGILSDAWNDFPENIRSIIQMGAVHVAWFVETVKNAAEELQGYWKAMEDGWGGLSMADVYNQSAEAARRNSAQLDESIAGILEERQLIIDTQKAIEHRTAAEREAFAERRRQKVEGDRLAGFGLGKDTDKGADAGAKKAADAAAKAAAKRLEGLRNSLRTEEEAIADSYAERQAIIEASLAKGSAEYEKLSQRSAAQRDRELEELAESRSRDFDNLSRSLMSEEEAIQHSYNRRIEIIEANTTASSEARERLRAQVEADREKELGDLATQAQDQLDQLMRGLMTEQEEVLHHHEERRAAILEATRITEEQRQDLLRREEERFMEESAARERQRIAMITGSAGDMFGALAGLMQQYAEGSDKQSKKMFKVAQAFSIAQAIISIATGISKAQELGYPMNIFESVRVAAVGAAQIGAIKSQQYAGAYDQGGQIPAGRWGIVGELGPEIVRGPATVTGRELTARNAGQGGGGGVQVSVQVNVQTDGSATTSVKSDDEHQGRQLGQLVGAKCIEVMQQEMRPGGLLWRGGVRNG